MLDIWLVLQLFVGQPGPPDTIVIAAVSLQSAWHLGDQTERGSGEGDRERREGRKEGSGKKGFLRREFWQSF